MARIRWLKFPAEPALRLGQTTMRLDRRTADIMRDLARQECASLSALLETMLLVYAKHRSYVVVLEDGSVLHDPSKENEDG